MMDSYSKLASGITAIYNVTHFYPIGYSYELNTVPLSIFFELNFVYPIYYYPTGVRDNRCKNLI